MVHKLIQLTHIHGHQILVNPRRIEYVTDGGDGNKDGEKWTLIATTTNNMIRVTDTKAEVVGKITMAGGC